MQRANKKINIGILVLGWFCFISYFKFFQITQYYAIISIGVAAIIPTIALINNRAKIPLIVLPWIIYALIFTLGIFGEQRISTVIAWAIQKWMIVVIVAYLVNSKNGIDDSIRVFCGFSLVHVTATVLEFIAPNFIHGLTQFLLRANEASETLRLFGFQYHCGIAQQASYNAVYIAVAICVFIPYLFDNFSSKGRWKPISLLVLSIVALILTGKRGAIVAIVISVVVTVVAFLVLKKGTKLKFVIPGILVFITISWAVANTDIAVNIIRRMQYADDFMSNRENLWGLLIEGIRNQPLIGNGSASFSVVSRSSGHNSFLQVWYENGLIGLLCVLFIFAQGIYLALKGYRNNNSNENGRYYLSSLMFQIYFAIVCFTDSMFLHNVSCVCYVVFLCITYKLTLYDRRAKRQRL